MRIRGERECQECGTRWTYYETGSVECPDCGSLRSVGVDERTRHTASPVTLDLTPVREAVDTETLATIAERAAEEASEFVRRYGFIDAGELRPLDDTFVAATELKHVARTLTRSMDVTDDEQRHFLTLLDGAESGQRPDASSVPETLVPARGLAAADAVSDYRRDLCVYLEDNPDEDARTVLGSVEDYRTRVDALDGDVPPEQAEALIEAARAVGASLIDDDPDALSRARDRLATLDPGP
ncbi:MAG: TFIIB-type zinc ribbon-containing protein [Halorhabdus sp.]